MQMTASLLLLALTITSRCSSFPAACLLKYFDLSILVTNRTLPLDLVIANNVGEEGIICSPLTEGSEYFWHRMSVVSSSTPSSFIIRKCSFLRTTASSVKLWNSFKPHTVRWAERRKTTKSQSLATLQATSN